MDEMSTNERREMTRGVIEAAPSNALLDALGLREPAAGSERPETTPRPPPLAGPGAVGHDDGHCGSRRAPGVPAPGVSTAPVRTGWSACSSRWWRR